MNAYSPSRLGTFENCPLRYKLAYIDEVETEEGQTIEAFTGSLVHAALERLYRDVLRSRPVSIEDTVAFFDQQWLKDWDDTIEIVRAEDRPEHYQDRGRRCLRTYFERYQPFDQDRTLALERRVSTKIGPGDRYKITGFCDRIARARDGALEIIDYKTSSRLPTQDELREDRQLAMYQLAVRTMWRAPAIRLVWHYLTHGETLSLTLSDEELERIEQQVVALIEQIEGTTVFPPRETGLCDWCDYWEHCPRKKHAARVEPLPAESFRRDDGVKLVNEYAKLKLQAGELNGKIDSLKEKLAAFARKYGYEVILGGTHKVSVSFYQRLKFPAASSDERAALEKFVRETKRWDEVSGLDTGALAEVLEEKRWPAPLLEKLEAFAEKVESSSVSLSRRKEEE